MRERLASNDAPAAVDVEVQEEDEEIVDHEIDDELDDEVARVRDR